jgi:hypothetical protein
MLRRVTITATTSTPGSPTAPTSSSTSRVPLKARRAHSPAPARSPSVPSTSTSMTPAAPRSRRPAAATPPRVPTRARRRSSTQASDGGSGVDHVTVALGNTVLATAQNTCQAYNLQPAHPRPQAPSTSTPRWCPAVPTRHPHRLRRLRQPGAGPGGDGHHPQPPGTQSLPRPTKPGSVHTKVELSWHWTPASTVLTKLTIRKLARSATITVGCAGRRCPFKTRRGDGRHATRFVKAMERRVFTPGRS